MQLRICGREGLEQRELSSKVIAALSLHVIARCRSATVPQRHAAPMLHLVFARLGKSRRRLPRSGAAEASRTRAPLPPLVLTTLIIGLRQPMMTQALLTVRWWDRSDRARGGACQLPCHLRLERPCPDGEDRYWLTSPVEISRPVRNPGRAISVRLSLLRSTDHPDQIATWLCAMLTVRRTS
jgi:hypothetical protein